MKLIEVKNLNDLIELNLENHDNCFDISITGTVVLHQITGILPIKITHRMPNTSFHFNVKFIVYENVDFEIPVEIRVEKGAIGVSTSFHALVYNLNSTSKLKVVPGMFIYEKNINSAAHGVVIKNLTRKDLIYFLARGVSENDAKNYVLGLM